MADHVFKLGALDLSEFLRVNPGDGLDPASSEYIEPQFSESPLREGGVLVNEDLNNREQEWPLFLGTRIGATRNIVAAHRAAIQAELRKPNTMIEWREPGASDSTFYEFQGGRLEEDYNIRISAKGRAKAMLRSWVSPYGYGATAPHGVHMADASGVGQLAPIAGGLGTIAGDVPAEIALSIGPPSLYNNGDGFHAAVAAIPSGYAWRHPAASIVGLAETGATWAAGSQAGVINENCKIGLSPASIYLGRGHRVLALVRSAGGEKSVAMRAFFDGKPIGATAMATARGAALVDLGVVRVPENYQGATISIELERLGPPTYSLFTQNIDPGVASTMLNEIYVLPEDALAFAQVPGRTPLAYTTFEGTRAITPLVPSYPIIGELEDFGNIWSLPTDMISATSPFRSPLAIGSHVVAWQAASGFQTAAAELAAISEEDLTIRGTFGASPNLAFATTGSASAGMGFSMNLYDVSNDYFSVIKGGGQRSFSLSRGAWSDSGGGGDTLLASIGLASPLADMHMIMRKQGGRLSAQLYSVASPMLRVLTGAGAATFVPCATLAAPVTNYSMSPGFFLRGTRGLCHLHDITVSSVPSMMRRFDDSANTADIVFDGHEKTSYLQSSLDTFLHIDSLVRGRIPQVKPEDYAVVGLVQPIEHSHSNGFFSLFLTGRNRFSYAR